MESANEDARAALSKNDEEKLRDALGRGADPDFGWIAGAPLTGGKPNTWTLLAYAIDKKLDGCCRLLLTRGADPNRSDGITLPLQHACAFGTPTIQRLLLDAGADVNLRDTSGSTALHYATRSSNEDSLRLLIRRGASLELKNKRGDTPMAIAVAYNNRNTALFLLRAGARPQALKYGSVTPSNRDLNDYMIDILNDGWAARAQKHQDACLRVVSRCAPLPRDVMLSIVSYWSLPH